MENDSNTWASHGRAPRDSAELLERLCAADPHCTPPRAMVVVSHPDDEVIGVGSRILWLKNAVFVHVTDGAPRDLQDARAAGFATREAYAAARRLELREALGLAGVSCEQLVALNFPDREAAFKLVPITSSIARLIDAYEPEVVLTHSYEGGHPDHDSTCFCVHAACGLRRRATLSTPAIVEMAFYHQGSSGMVTGEFLPGRMSRIVRLTDSESELKKRMLGCFRSQKFLENFGSTQEQFRVAPEYQFEQPPHEGTLFYETLDWGFSGEQWRTLALEASRVLADGQQVQGG